MASAPTAVTASITVPRFTVDMLDEMPDTGHRYELLDGFLLVTPPPRPAHEIIVTRLHVALAAAFVNTGAGYVFSRSAVHPSERTYFEPDLLVTPATISLDFDAEWADVKTWWLVVEVLSAGSRVYDKLKMDAYLKLGVESVWLVDPTAREIRVYDRGAAEPLAFGDGDTLRWRPAALAQVLAEPLQIDGSAVFRGVGRDRSRDDE
jgi:Uma2 family endonuclease